MSRAGYSTWIFLVSPLVMEAEGVGRPQLKVSYGAGDKTGRLSLEEGGRDEELQLANLLLLSKWLLRDGLLELRAEPKAMRGRRTFWRGLSL